MNGGVTTTMFGGSGRNGFAIGFGAGICATILFFLWLSKVDGFWEYEGVLVTSSDTLAQWIMAAFGGLAVYLSFWGIIVIKNTLSVSRDTLNATRGMASEAREVGEKTIVEAKRAADNSAVSLRLDHPPKFKVTRSLAFFGADPTSLPTFRPGESINGRAFAVNYGRHTATIIQSDCRFYWAKNGIVPMSHAWSWMQEHKNFVSLTVGDEKAETIQTGNNATWIFNTIVPEDFIIDAKGKWSHHLFIVGLIRYTGEAGDKRGLYFYKRYVPALQHFEDAKEYEIED